MKSGNFSTKKETYDEFRNVINDKMTRKLRLKQLNDAFFMLIMKKVSNFSVPGSGKTTSVLAVYAYLKYKKKVDKIIMIGPKNSFETWVKEYNVCFEKKDEAKVFNIQEKNNVNKREELVYGSKNKNLFLFNYESLPKYTEALLEIIDEKTLLVYDEIHRIKGFDISEGKPKKYANKAIEISKKSQYTIALTGTPIPNSYLDIYNLLNILYGNEYKDFFSFAPNMLKNPNNKEINTINEKINPFFCRTTKKELGVPEPEKDIIYDILATKTENEILKILKNVYRKNKLALCVRILQLESNPKMLLESIDKEEFANVLDISSDDIEDIEYKNYSEEIKELINSVEATSKMKKCVEEIVKMNNRNKKVIIWCIFKESMKKIKKILNENGIKAEIINGSVELFERQERIENFKNHEFNILITNPHTLAESVSLHNVCHDAVYFEYSYNLVHLLQSKDRIHRLGLLQNQKTQYYFMNTVYNEENNNFSLGRKIYDRLKLKEDNMIEAIENHRLETIFDNNIEDLEKIFDEFI